MVTRNPCVLRWKLSFARKAIRALLKWTYYKGPSYTATFPSISWIPHFLSPVANKISTDFFFFLFWRNLMEKCTMYKLTMIKNDFHCEILEFQQFPSFPDLSKTLCDFSWHGAIYFNIYGSLFKLAECLIATYARFCLRQSESLRLFLPATRCFRKQLQTAGKRCEQSQTERNVESTRAIYSLRSLVE